MGRAAGSGVIVGVTVSGISVGAIAVTDENDGSVWVAIGLQAANLQTASVRLNIPNQNSWTGLAEFSFNDRRLKSVYGRAK